MTTSQILNQSTTAAAATAPTPGWGRRTVLAVTGFLACALPAAWTVNLARMVLTGIDTDHRFHQLTGQGLILCVLWLLPLVAMLRAGWRGERPATGWGWSHITFVVTGSVCAAAAPGGGAPALMGLIIVTGALFWAALPQRPRLSGAVRIHPALAPAALLTSAFYVPYAIEQLRLQNAVTTGMHVHNPHFFDMAWLVIAFAVLAGLSSVLVLGRRLAAWAGFGSLAVGLAGLLTGEDVVWSACALGLGVLVVLAETMTRRAGGVG